MYIYPLLSTEKLQNSFYNNLNIFFDIVYINLFWVNLLDTAGRQLDILEMTWFISNVNGSFILIRSYMNKTPNDTIPNNKCSENLLNKFIKTNDAEDILYHYAVKYYTRFNTISYIHNIIIFIVNKIKWMRYNSPSVPLHCKPHSSLVEWLNWRAYILLIAIQWSICFASMHTTQGNHWP